MARGVRARFELEGAKELAANLRKLPERLQKSTVDRALKKVAQPIADDAESRIEGQSAWVARKVAVSTQLSRRQRRGAPKPKGERQVYVGVRPHPLAHLFEFGSGPRYTKGGAYRGMMQPTPFLRPAWDHGRNRALDDLGRIMGQEIEAAARRLHRRQAKAAR